MHKVTDWKLTNGPPTDYPEWFELRVRVNLDRETARQTAGLVNLDRETARQTAGLVNLDRETASTPKGWSTLTEKERDQFTLYEVVDQVIDDYYDKYRNIKEIE